MAAGLENAVTINSQKYPVASGEQGLLWQVVEVGEDEVYTFTLGGGMGETVCRHEGRVCPGYYFAEGIDNSDGTLRLQPTSTVVGTSTSGSVTTGSTSTTLEAGGTPGWTTDQWKNYTVTVYSGTAVGQARRITANDADTLTVTPAWGTTPASGDGYAINLLGSVAFSPLTFFEDFDAAGARAFYARYRDRTTTPDVITTKIRTSDDVPVDREVSPAASSATCPRLGATQVFEGATYVPLGDESGSNVIQKLATVGSLSTPTDDTWENGGAGVFLGSGANTQDGSTAKFVQAIGNTYRLAAVEPKTDANFGSAFEVGDSSTDIIWAAETSDGAVFFFKQDNLYTGDGKGNSYAVLPFNYTVRKKQLSTYDDFDGHMGCVVGGSAVLYPSRWGFWRYDAARRRANDLSLDASPDYREVQNISNVPIRLRHYATVAVGHWVYSIYRPGTGVTATPNHILCGYYDAYADPEIQWRSLIYSTTTVHGLYVDSANRLWCVTAPDDASTTVSVAPTSVLRYFQLAADGSPRTALDANRGTQSTTHEWYGSELVFDRTRQVRLLKVATENYDANASLQLKLQVGGGSWTSIGAAITSDGLLERAPTAGTGDTGQRARMRMTITTGAGYTPASMDPRVLRAWMVLRSPDIIRVIIDATAESLRAVGLTPQDAEDNLRQLQNAQVVTVQEPGSEASFSARVVRVTDTREVSQTSEDIGYGLEVMLERVATD